MTTITISRSGVAAGIMLFMLAGCVEDTSVPRETYTLNRAVPQPAAGTIPEREPWQLCKLPEDLCRKAVALRYENNVAPEGTRELVVALEEANIEAYKTCERPMNMSRVNASPKGGMKLVHTGFSQGATGISIAFANETDCAGPRPGGTFGIR